METIYYTTMKSPFGKVLLTGTEKGLLFLGFQKSPEKLIPEKNWVASKKPFGKAVKQLEDYFAGRRKVFDLDLDLRGTPFQRRVWKELLKIPYGKTLSYGDIARRIGKPKSCRAVGGANHANPVAVIVPCHRVIGASGKLTGYGGGLPIKRGLLALEGVQNED